MVILRNSPTDVTRNYRDTINYSESHGGSPNTRSKAKLHKLRLFGKSFKQRSARAAQRMERRQAEPKDGTGYDIRVSNLPPDATKEEITIHFQKRKHGGGDVKSVRLTKDGVAHVTFEREESKWTAWEKSSLKSALELRKEYWRVVVRRRLTYGHSIDESLQLGSENQNK